MTIRLTRPEIGVLRGLWFGAVEEGSQFPDVSRDTFAQMLARGWIERASDERRRIAGYRITAAGKDVLSVAWDAGVRPIN